MRPAELVEKYIVNREAVFQHPAAFGALVDFGRSPKNRAALAEGAKFLQRQLYGNSLAFLVTPDESGDLLEVEFSESKNLDIDGSQAELLRRGAFPRDRGLMWSRVGTTETELVTSDLHKRDRYVELSRQTRAVFNLPMECKSGPLGVFSIETSDVSDFLDAKRLGMISNFAELVFHYKLNSQIESLQSRISSVTEQVEGLQRLSRARDQLQDDMAVCSPSSWTILALLSANGPVAIGDAVACLADADDAFESVCRLYIEGYMSYSNACLALTPKGADRLKSLGLLN